MAFANRKWPLQICFTGNDFYILKYTHLNCPKLIRVGINRLGNEHMIIGNSQQEETKHRHTRKEPISLQQPEWQVSTSQRTLTCKGLTTRVSTRQTRCWVGWNWLSRLHFQGCRLSMWTQNKTELVPIDMPSSWTFTELRNIQRTEPGEANHAMCWKIPKS